MTALPPDAAGAAWRRGTAFAAFIALGMPGAILGVTWKAMHVDFGVSLDSLGVLLLAGTAGFALSSFLTGRLVEKLGLGRLLFLSSMLAPLAMTGYGLTGSWLLLLFCGFISGVAGGLIDSALNIFLAQYESSRIANWLHASFGVGAALGPLVATAMIALERSWRDGYLVVAGLQLLVVAALALALPAWRRLPRPVLLDDPQTVPAGRLRNRPAVWLGIALFFIYTSVEVATGQWAFIYLTEARGVAEVMAGAWTSAFWLFLTGGRVFFGFLSGRVAPFVLLRLGVGGVLAGSLLLLVGGLPGVNLLGLAIMGTAMAPIFPLLVAVTPARLGHRAAARVMGLQVGAAGLGGAAGPSAVGVLVAAGSAAVVGPALAVGALLQVLLYGLARRGDSREIAGRQTAT